MGPYKNGTVQQIINRNDKQYIIRIVEVRTYGDADKLAARFAQKGLVTVLRDPSELPTVHIDGEDVKPDLMINPLGIIGRNTPGYSIEGLISAVGILTGQRFNASAFKTFDEKGTSQILTDNSYDPDMSYPATNPFTGELYENKITLIPLYYQALPHHVLDKYQIRNIGKRKAQTGQPVGHRDAHGAQAQRFGEQEVLAMTSHGAQAMLVERVSISSDVTPVAVCQRCGETSLVVRVGEQTITTCSVCRDKANIGRIMIPMVAETFRQLSAGFGINIRYTGLKPA